MQYHGTNYKRKFNNDKFNNSVINSVSKKVGHVLTNPEKEAVISHIRKLDPDLLAPEHINKTMSRIIKRLANKFKMYNQPQQYDDTQGMLRQTIGITSESSTVHGMYDDPNFVIRRTQPDELNTSINVLNQQENSINQQPPPQTQIQNLQAQIQQLQLHNRSDDPIRINRLLGMNTTAELTRLLNPQSMERKNYMLLDSRYRVTSGGDTAPIKNFVWNYVNVDTQGTGSVNVVGNVRDIIALRVYPFRIPYVEAADNKYKRISVAIGGFEAQSFRAHENRRFHFLLESVIDSDFINLETNKYNDGFFHFEKPVTNPDNLTVSFGSPLEPIVFDNDRDDCTFDYFGIAPLTQITTTTPHNLANGDRVYFSQFNVGPTNPALPQQGIINELIKDTINRQSGFLINVIDPLNFSIPYDSSAITNPIAGLPVRVYYGSKRIFMPVEITYLKPEKSIYN